MPLTIAIVGTGPTGIYTFRELVQRQEPLSIWLFERGREAGVGLPFSPQVSSKGMLANIASFEIPEVTSTYLQWLEALPVSRLHQHGLEPRQLDARLFTPRLLLGEYFREQLMALVEGARAKGHEVTLCESTNVTDIELGDRGIRLVTDGGRTNGHFDRVILATGHVFPDDDDASRGFFPSPWSGLIDADIPAGRVGIMGASLSAIDAAMAVVDQHGTFCRRCGEELTFETSSEGLEITMMSRTGVLPEADFYFPVQHKPLAHMTSAALAAAGATANVYDAVYDLFRAEIASADPEYARAIELDDLTADTFADAYFAGREAHDPFRWARENLKEVERNKADEKTVPWRYAILRMHEAVEDIVPDLSDADRHRFDRGLKRVFVDNYAAVPSESIRRLLALRDAGMLSILALGEDYSLGLDAGRTVIEARGRTWVFDTFIDARGQEPLTTRNLPFPTLRAALLSVDCEIPEVDEDYTLIAPSPFAGRISLGAIPYLMHDQPFAQGIRVAADIGQAMARCIERNANHVSQRRRRRWR
ncbi:MAG: FAD/NAD(P)-binding protein [Gammaproteobacteria bacterium]|nr:FAD/NAD(P)-binding protein [Gammaproteobacteria bacterium]